MRHIKVLNRQSVVSQRPIGTADSRVRGATLPREVETPGDLEHVEKMCQRFMTATQPSSNVAEFVEGFDLEQSVVDVE
jgi:hypothetical protein